MAGLANRARGVCLIGTQVMLLVWRISALAPTLNLPTFAYEDILPGLGEEFVYRGVFLMLLNEAFGRPWKFAGIQLGWGFIIVTAMSAFCTV